MRRVAPLLALASVVVLAAAAPAVGHEHAGGGDELPPPKVKVLDRGDAPRQKLRLDVEPGHEAARVMTMQFEFEQEIDGDAQPSVPIPPVRQVLRIQVGDIAGDDIAYQVDFEAAEVVDAGDFDPELVAQLEEQIGTLVGLAGRVIVNTRGIVLRSALDVPEDVDPMIATLLEQVDQQLDQFASPFPRPAVGTGARWTVTSSAELIQGIETKNVAEYEIVELDEERIVLDVSLEQTAEPQAVDLPGVPAGVDVRISEFALNGSGTLTLDLTSVIATSGSIEVAGDQAFVIEDDGDEQELVQHLRVEATLEPRD